MRPRLRSIKGACQEKNLHSFSADPLCSATQQRKTRRYHSIARAKEVHCDMVGAFAKAILVNSLNYLPQARLSQERRTCVPAKRRLCCKRCPCALVSRGSRWIDECIAHGVTLLHHLPQESKNHHISQSTRTMHKYVWTQDTYLLTCWQLKQGQDIPINALGSRL